MANISKSVKLRVFTLAIMNVTAVVSLRGLPAEAEYGLSSAFYYLFAAIVFLIPTSLVAAELACVRGQARRCSDGWVKPTERNSASRHLPAMGGKHHLVSHHPDFRSRGTGIYRHGDTHDIALASTALLLWRWS